MDKTKPCLQKTKWGFYRFSPPPSEQELREYYSNKYYQQSCSLSYSMEYDEEELTWRRAIAELIVMMAEKLRPDLGGCVLDVGCGEGFQLEAFYSRRLTVKGFDFSKAAIGKWHPHLLPYFQQGDIYDLLQAQIEQGMQYDVIFLGNVIEHVADPEQLLCSLRSLLARSGLLIIVAPNDFSDFQQFILDNNFADSPWWIAYPDHLSYFNKDSMHAFVRDLGYSVLETLANFPMELNLLSSNSNYLRGGGETGPEAHRQRMSIDNYLYNKSPEALLSICQALGNISLGRNLVYYCTHA